MIASIVGPGHEISTYVISDQQMSSGSTLGGPKGTLWIKATGAIEKFWSTDAGMDMFGTLVLHHWDERTGIPLTALPGDFIIHPDRQDHVFELSNGVTVREELFVLSSKPRGADLRDVDPPAAYYSIRLQNDTDEEVCIATVAGIQLRGGFEGRTRTEYDKKHNAFVVYNDAAPNVVRYAACSVAPGSYEVTMDAAKAHAVSFPGKLSNKTLDNDGHPIALFQLSNTLKRGECAEWYFVLTFTTDGDDAARRLIGALPDCKTAHERTREHYDEVLGRAVVITPDRDVNRGVLWAKANMLRVESLAHEGWAFTNDPARSSHSVCRDTCWFAFGSDYITPHFSRDALLGQLRHVSERGMATEFYDIRNGKADDYGLNINDNTPLLILACWHHYSATGDRAFLEQAYPILKKMAQYILSQRNGEGLVWCNAEGTGERGIVGWRNVIKDFRVSGASTELNAECFAALTTLATIARELEDDVQEKEALAEAERLRAAINEHLLDKERNVYYLNIDVDGTRRTDVTSDLIFPIMFKVADHDTAANIISRLSVPEFWKEPGIHTVPRTAITYSPTKDSGLLGGIWVGVTFWYAFAAASFNSEFMSDALSASFRHYASDPRHNNTVPGQFSEWLHGETLVNQGMMLSPWYPPRYLWAAVEGLAGLDISSNTAKLDPKPARDWKWLGVRNLPLRGKAISWFAVRMEQLTVYVNHRFESVDEERTYEDDISDCAAMSGEEMVVIALKRSDRIALFVGNTLDRTASTALRLNVPHLEQYCTVRAFNSLRSEWTQYDDFDCGQFKTGFPLQVDRHGFCVIELRSKHERAA